MLRFAQYPEPSWITGPRLIAALWFAMTSLLPLAWWFAKRRHKWAALISLWGYCALSMLVLGHYGNAHPSALSPRINGLIALEAICAGLLFVAAPFALRMRA